MSKGRATMHVTPSPRGGWQVKREGSSRATVRTETQKEAIDAARALAKLDRPAQVIVHRPNNQIRTEFTYGNDPERYPG